MDSSSRSEGKTKLKIDDIAAPQRVIHPALDWVQGQLIVGVVLRGNDRAVVSSQTGLVQIDQFGCVCERGMEFESPVTPDTARAFEDHLGGSSTQDVAAEAREVLEFLAAYLKRFIVFPDTWWPQVLATWVLGTYLYPIFQTYPYLHITSPEPGCGKSLLGQIIANLSFNGELLTSLTEANLFRLVETNRGVQVWDEVELKSEPEMRRFQAQKAILLNGYRNGGVVPRTEGKGNLKVVRFHVYCPRVLIGLSSLPEPAQQRTIVLGLRKRTLNEPVELYRTEDQRNEELTLKGRCLLLALKRAGKVNNAYQGGSLRKQLEQLFGQAGREPDDIWLPLFSVSALTVESSEAELTQTEWLRKMMVAAVEVVNRRPKPENNNPKGTRCSAHELTIIRALDFLERMGTVEPNELAARVSADIGFDIPPQTLGKLLKPHGIRARKCNGRRVFKAGRLEITAARDKLGLPQAVAAPIIEGQQGQEGRVEEREEQLAVTTVTI